MTKTEQLIILIDESTKTKFKGICVKEKTTMTDVVIECVENYIKNKTKKVIY